MYWSKGPDERDELRAELIINFSGMCLVRTVGDPAWWMGQLHQNDESIVCWGQYGTDLARRSTHSNFLPRIPRELRPAAGAAVSRA